ncbi:MAG: T9SS type A sorting domain-containing protein [Chitinophagaceae bacterium]|nr:MAG: T9SS type A sorting domain-containing protein [Chitinophagaceae bacterium]
MKRFYAELRHSAKLCAALILCLVVSSSLRAEGTRQVSAAFFGDAGIGMLVSTAVNAGPYAGSIAANKVRFVMKEGEHFYFGVQAYNRDERPKQVRVFYRIFARYDPVTPLASGFIDSTESAAGRIDNWAQADMGPQQVYGAGGYNGVTFNPANVHFNGAGDTTEFYIEVYEPDAGNSNVALAGQNTVLTYFDFAVADAANTKEILGRVFSQGWSFITYNYNTDPGNTDPWNNTATLYDPSNTPFVGLQTLAMELVDFYGYTDDNYLSKITLSKIYPLAFVIYFNKYGTNQSQTDWSVGRQSIYYRQYVLNNIGDTVLTNPPLELDGGYRVFISQPDSNVFTLEDAPTAPTTVGTLSGCPGNLSIPVVINEPGDVRLTLEFGSPVDATRTRTLYAFEPANLTYPDTVFVAWDGKDGLGNPVTIDQNLTASASSTVLRGRTNLPLFDAETNPGGMLVLNYNRYNGPDSIDFNNPPLLYWSDTIVAIYSNPLWDDCGNTDVQYRENNSTPRGYDVSLDGISQNGVGQRAWDGAPDLNVAPPFPAANNGLNGSATAELCDDFGNNRVLNTWWWVSQTSEPSAKNIVVPNFAGCTLPVTLVQFAGQKNGNTVKLTWETVSEVNFDRFVVERSFDGRGFTAIGTVEALRQPRNTYRFTDGIAAITSPRIYYRLRMIDIGGAARYSRTVMVLTSSTGEFSISNLPNPVTGAVQFQANVAVAGNAQVEVADASGKVLYRTRLGLLPGANPVQLDDMKPLPAGVYVLQVELGGIRETRKLIVNR